MIDLKPYEEYKSTGFQWLNNVPEHWDIRPNKYLWSERKQVDFSNEQMLSVTINDGVILQSELLKATSKKDSSNMDKSKYKLVKPNDITYNKMRMWQGAVGVSKHQGIVSPAYIVLKPNKEFNNKYYHYLLRTPNYIEESYRYSYGICDDQLSLRFEEFKSMYNIVPPKKEQDQIVRFLDSKLLKINKFIKNKKKLIELLKEKKQAVINQAVTKGLDPDAKMRPSGIEWLGDVPEGWEVKRLKHYTLINPSIRNFLERLSLDEKVVFLPMEKITVDGVIDNTEQKKISEVKSGFSCFARNDVVIAKITPCFENGKGACLDKLKSIIGYGTTELIVLRAKYNILPKYLYFITRSSYFRQLGSEVMTGSAGQKRVPINFVSNFALGVPDISEQKYLLGYVEKQLTNLSRAINRITKEIELITEYRTSLISAVVTGQVDVRDVHIEEHQEVLEEQLEAMKEELPVEQEIPESEAI